MLNLQIPYEGYAIITLVAILQKRKLRLTEVVLTCSSTQLEVPEPQHRPVSAWFQFSGFLLLCYSCGYYLGPRTGAEIVLGIFNRLFNTGDGKDEYTNKRRESSSDEQRQEVTTIPRHRETQSGGGAPIRGKSSGWIGDRVLLTWVGGRDHGGRNCDYCQRCYLGQREKWAEIPYFLPSCCTWFC